jgi:hypothetical protein
MTMEQTSEARLREALAVAWTPLDGLAHLARFGVTLKLVFFNACPTRKCFQGSVPRCD